MKRKGNQTNRVYTDYGGHPACQGCEVYDLIVCPLVEHAFNKNRKMNHCMLLRPFAEKIISRLRIEDKRRKV
jgi:hypothetical protein